MGFVEDKRFSKYGAKCLFFDRFGGVSSGRFESLNVGFNVGDTKENVRTNLDRVKSFSSAAELGLLNQIHSDKIVEYDGTIHNADGLYTKKRGVFLGVRFADCLPVVLMDVKSKIVMVLHAGWKGTFLEISKKGVETLEKYGAKTDNILVSIGPHICGNCYEIKDDVASKFDDRFLVSKKNGLYLDLEKANVAQLVSAGVLEKNINSIGICTYENRSFFSYRRDGVCGRNIGGIVME